MLRKITPLELDSLRKRIAPYSRYKEVEESLLQQLTNRIESKWEIDPEMDFSIAMAKAIRDYGYSNIQNGYLIMEKTMQKSINKSHLNLFYQLLKPVHWPVLFVLLFISIQLPIGFSRLNPKVQQIISIVCIVIFIILLSAHLFRRFKYYKSDEKLLKKKFDLIWESSLLICIISCFSIFEPHPLDRFQFDWATFRYLCTVLVIFITLVQIWGFWKK